MEIDGVGAIPLPRRPMQTTGKVPDAAETRAKLREATPPGRWDAVMQEVTRLQADESMSPLAAMKAVYAKLAGGWQPR